MIQIFKGSGRLVQCYNIAVLRSSEPPLTPRNYHVCYIDTWSASTCIRILIEEVKKLTVPYRDLSISYHDLDAEDIVTCPEVLCSIASCMTETNLPASVVPLRELIITELLLKIGESS